MNAPARTADVVIVGAGPSGLRAAAELASRGVDTLVLDREKEAGGIPRHCHHPGYGVRDLRTFISGPTYARRIAATAADAGATIRTQATVTGWAGPRCLEVTSPQGRETITGKAVILATGARERPRPARLIPGDRPHGVYTTGHLQNLVYLNGGKPGKRAVVVGSELVSWSAVTTLRHAGCKTVAMLTEQSRGEAYGVFSLARPALIDAPVATRTRVRRIIGRPHLEAVEIEHLDTGRRRIVECDVLVLTGDWIPDHELARAAGLPMAAGSKSPLVDTALRTPEPGVFAVGNLAHPVDTADVAALDGAHVAPAVLDWLDGGSAPDVAATLHADAPFRWIAPSQLRTGDTGPARGKFLLWGDEYVARPTVVVRSGENVVARRRVPWPVAPGRMFRLPAQIFDGVTARGDLRVGLG